MCSRLDLAEMIVPRYFFQVSDGSDFVDLHGMELADLNAAKNEAARFAGGLLADMRQTDWQTSGWTMRVTDESHDTLLQLSILATTPPSSY